MISGLNDSKKHYFIWTAVTVAIFAVVFALSWGTTGDYPKYFAGLLAYCVATIPIGFFVRRKYLHWYVHVPTEKIKIFEANIVVALYRLTVVWVLAAFNLALLWFYLGVSFLFGFVLFPYHLISGIVFMLQKKI